MRYTMIYHLRGTYVDSGMICCIIDEDGLLACGWLVDNKDKKSGVS